MGKVNVFVVLVIAAAVLFALWWFTQGKGGVEGFRRKSQDKTGSPVVSPVGAGPPGASNNQAQRPALISAPASSQKPTSTPTGQENKPKQAKTASAPAQQNVVHYKAGQQLAPEDVHKTLVIPVTVSAPAQSGKGTGLKVVKVPTLFDAFTPEEDTVALYGVTKEQLNALVEEYKQETKYEVPAAPNTLTFSVKKWQAAQEAQEESMINQYTRHAQEEDGRVARMIQSGKMRVRE